ncbi:NUDIX hydrolase [Radiobacillus sp. PE A8.2]|uniref:NUDIX hydrolase n=1 Tax=Radiobacillus sp. PE A8.2 TaxID=3380349 RepID=UPI003890A467
MNQKSIVDKVINHQPTILGGKRFSKYAVLIPLIQKENEMQILFEVRAETMRRQPGEICFPGGRMDRQDSTAQAAAIRETTEELGINTTDIENVYPLDYLVSPFGMVVYSHVGFIHTPEKMQPNPSEVGELFTVPLRFFQETKPKIYKVNLDIQPEENFPFDLIAGGENYNWRNSTMDEYFYTYDGKVIWGLTAKIITHFIEILEEA